MTGYIEFLKNKIKGKQVTEYIKYETDDIIVSAKETSQIREEVYESLSGEDAEVAVCVWVWTIKRIDKLKNCIDSILKYTNDVKYKLVLLNNGGGETVTEYFETIPYEDKMIIEVSKNLSSPHGSGIIMRMIKNQFCAQVLNDCVVTENWLSNLMICMKSDRKIGMVCPMSTTVSNLQMVDAQIHSLEEAQNFALEFNKSNPLLWEERLRLMPICGLYRRAVFDQVGIYDPGFMHEFADDDLSLRIRRSGYKLVLAGDTFVHHDHIYSGEDAGSQENMDVGREGFKTKYHGLDAWTDFMNFIKPHLKDIELEVDVEKEYTILGVDCKCGTPILDMKNKFIQNGAKKISLYAYTSEAKYYEDLLSIAKGIECDINIENLYKYYHDMYDCIILDKYINLYDKPLDLLQETLNHIKSDGILFFRYKNLFDVENFLTCLGHTEFRNNTGASMLCLEDLIELFEKVGQNDIRIFSFNKQIDENLKNVVTQAIRMMSIVKGDLETVINRLFVDEYVFVLKKK